MIDIVKNKITLLNAVSSLLLQFFTIISGFIIPKLILTCFGSEVNGLVSSITQFLSYISLLEGGITGVIMANLYKPLLNKDEKKISSIVNTAQNFFHKVSILFIIYTFILAILYPLVFNTGFSFSYVFSLVLILSLNLLIQYAFSLTFKTLLNADKKVYIVSLTQALIIILSIIFAIVSVKFFPNIHFFKFISGLLFFIQPIIYNYFVKKYFKIDKKAKKDNNLIANRWNGFAINIASFIHNSTDIVVLSIFTNLKVVSIYSVYSLVTSGLKQIVMAIINAITPTIGQLYASDDIKELNYKFDVYEYLTFFLVFFLHSVAILLVTPFVMIYTKNIIDTNYFQPIFGILLLIAEIFYLIKLPHLNLAYSANKFKEMTKPSYIEAVMNIFISVILVKKYGLIGVALGTLGAMIYRMIFQINFTNKLINRSNFKFYFKFIIFFITSILGILICMVAFGNISYSLFDWVFHGIIYTLIMFILYFIISIIFYKKELGTIKEVLKK